MMEIKETIDKISALKALKEQINIAIRDEQEAWRVYDKMISQARQARTSSGISEIQVIRDQERDHETKFKTMLRTTERNITEYERLLKEQRNQAEEQRRKEEQERQRKEQEVRRTGAGARRR
jgi:rubrerythrin